MHAAALQAGHSCHTHGPPLHQRLAPSPAHPHPPGPPFPSLSVQVLSNLFAVYLTCMPSLAQSDDFTLASRRCYEVKCRGIQAISAEGSVNLDRHDVCYDTGKSIIIKIVSEGRLHCKLALHAAWQWVVAEVIGGGNRARVACCWDGVAGVWGQSGGLDG